MDEERLNECVKQANRIEDMAEALLDRVADDDTVSMSLLAEIKEKARTIYRLIDDEAMVVPS